MTPKEAGVRAATLRGTVPSRWRVSIDNLECRPGHPPRCRVVASDAGMAIIARPDTGRYHVTVNEGPGVATSLKAGAHDYNDNIGYDTAMEALTRLEIHVRKRARNSHAQAASLGLSYLPSCVSPVPGEDNGD